MMLKLIIVTLTLAIFLTVCSGVKTRESTSRSNVDQPTPGAQPTPDHELQKQIAAIAKDAIGRVGVYAVLMETGETVSLNADERFAMQSVVKLPISMAVAEQVQRGILKLDQKVKIPKEEYVPSNMRSPIRDANPNGAEMSIRELIRYAISESDGTAADVLQRLAGGASGVQVFVDSLGIAEMKVKYSHKEFGQKWELQYENWATPKATFDMLTRISGRGTGSGRDYNADVTFHQLLQFMTESNNPPNRLKGMLPPGTIVAHKTGTGGTRDGITSATNDVGIITLPNGNHIAIAVFVGDSKADLAAREAVIAKIAKAAFDRWTAEKTFGPMNAANFNERHALN